MAIVAERIGGQVKETVGIENLISVPQTTGAELANALRTHIEHYPIEIFEERKIEKVKLQGTEKSVSTVGGEMFHASAVIIATGRKLAQTECRGGSRIHRTRCSLFVRIVTVLSTKVSM